MELTQLSENAEPTRRRILKKDLGRAKYSESSIDAIVQKLASEKLIVTGEEGSIDVAHEALIREWELLQQWIEEDKSYLLRYRKLEAEAKAWRDSGRKSEYLLPGSRLKEARKFQKQQGDRYEFSTLILAFVRKSIQKQRIDLLTSGIIPTTIIAGVASFFVYRTISIDSAWRNFLQASEDKTPARKNEALKTLNSWGALKGANLQKGNFKDISLPKADLSGADLDRADLSHAYLDRANLSHADLYGANLSDAYLSGANLFLAHLDRADLSYANLSRADLTGANLSYANLSVANLSGADLSVANLSGADLSVAHLSGADLSFAHLSFADLSGADLSGADLSGADLSGAYLIKTKDLIPNQIKSACGWNEAYYKGNRDQSQNQWIVDEKANREYIARLEQDKTSDPKTPPDCSKWK